MSNGVTAPKDLLIALKDIQYLMDKQLKSQEELADLHRSGLSPAMEDERRRDLQEDIEKFRQRCEAELKQLIDFPPRFIRHFDKLKTFWGDGDYTKSVFIMTKFPVLNSTDEKDKKLERVITAISDAITGSGYTPRIARGPRNYHPGLWDNVELHLLGCPRGIAVVEDRYLDELNPNVAMEWGWMRGMGKQVLFLVEKNFKNFRADLGDLLKETFSWDNPEPDISKVIKGWLGSSPD
jgi:hypothetical protein